MCGGPSLQYVMIFCNSHEPPINYVRINQAVSVRVRARTRTRAGAAHSVQSACVDLVPAVRAMCV